MAYKRVLIKLSGEAIGSQNETLDFEAIDQLALQIRSVVQEGTQVGIVVGGGNIWRGRSAQKMNRNQADHMGMLATVINSLALESALQNCGVPSSVLSAVPMEKFCDTYTYRGAMEKLNAGKVVIFACGTGSPFFSTDTTAALRAAEIGADALLLAKNVDALYSDDPRKNPQAERYSHLTYTEVIERKLAATDLTAMTLCRENHIPIILFSLKENDSLKRIVSGETFGTIVDGD